MPREYEAPTGDPNLGPESARDVAVLSNHIARWWGDTPNVFHEMVSQYVHVDLHFVPPTADHQYHVVVTTGMSDRPMLSGDGREFYCELMLALPPEWPMDQEKFKDERYWWPFRQLKQTARFPHMYKSVVWYGHTLGNGNPPRLFHETAPFHGSILSVPVLCPEGALSVDVRPGKRVYFFSFVPIYESELKFAWANGPKALLRELDQINVTELIQPGRAAAM